MLPVYSFGWKMVTHSRLCVSLSAKFDRLVQDEDLTQSGGRQAAGIGIGRAALQAPCNFNLKSV